MQRTEPAERAGADGASDDTLGRIAAYNEDDVRATMAVRDWLVDVRPDGVPWRPARLDDVSLDEEVDATVVALRELGGDADLLLADLLGFWGREGRAHNAQLRARAEAPEEHLVEDEGAIGGLYGAEVITRYTPKTGKVAKHPGLELRFPPQPVSLRVQGHVHPRGRQPRLLGGRRARRPAEGRVVLVLKEDEQERGEVPAGLALFTWIDPGIKRGVLAEFAQAAVDAGGVEQLDDARAQLLTRAPTRFVAGGGPADGRFGDDLDDMAAWVADLDRSWLAMQGPPGTGKTYRGARVIRELVRRGRRVGITAMSHAAIHNLVAATHEAFAESDELDLLACVVKPGSDVPDELDGVTYETRRRRSARARTSTSSPGRRGCSRTRRCRTTRSTCWSWTRQASWR